MPTPIVRLTRPEGVPEWLWEAELALFDPLGLVTPLAITRKAFIRALERVATRRYSSRAVRPVLRRYRRRR